MANATDTTNLNSPENEDDAVNGEEEKASQYQFPVLNSSEVPVWITFARRKFSKDRVDQGEILVAADNSTDISLPLPPNMSKGYIADWTTEDMGAWNNMLRQTGAAGYEEIKNLYKNDDKDLTSSLYDISGDIISKLPNFGKNLLYTGAAQAVTSSDTFRNVGAYVEGGAARNPYKATMFTSPQFRIFNFEYGLVARNFTEAEAIRNIIREFQIAMSPSFDETFGNNVYNYPDLFEITISNNDFLFDIAPSVLMDIQIHYHGEGKQLYIKGPNNERIPAVVNMQLSFRETKILTRTDFEDTTKRY